LERGATTAKQGSVAIATTMKGREELLVSAEEK